MTIIYIAHPISGDVLLNLERIKAIVRDINLTRADIVPLVPYYVDCIAMDDSVPAERQRGIDNNTAILRSGLIHQVWLYGDRISRGMRQEIWLADECGIEVVAMTAQTKAALKLLER